MKTCNKCKLNQEDSCFRPIKRKSGTMGLYSYCIPCERAYQNRRSKDYRLAKPNAGKEEYAKHKEARRAAAKIKYNNNKEHYKAISKANYEANREKMIEYNKRKAYERYAINKDYLTLIKSAPCIICNKPFHPNAMDMDHIDPTTKIGNVSKMVWSANHTKFKEEIAKCQVICVNCHRYKTFVDLYENKPVMADAKVRANRAYIQSIKSNNPCKDCGLKFHYSAMDFDHQRDKVKEVGLMTKKTREIIDLEISKCDLICACCHRLRHAN